MTAETSQHHPPTPRTPTLAPNFKPRHLVSLGLCFPRGAGSGRQGLPQEPSALSWTEQALGCVSTEAELGDRCTRRVLERQTPRERRMGKCGLLCARLDSLTPQRRQALQAMAEEPRPRQDGDTWRVQRGPESWGPGSRRVVGPSAPHPLTSICKAPQCTSLLPEMKVGAARATEQQGGCGWVGAGTHSTPAPRPSCRKEKCDSLGWRAGPLQVDEEHRVYVLEFAEKQERIYTAVMVNLTQITFHEKKENTSLDHNEQNAIGLLKFPELLLITKTRKQPFRIWVPYPLQNDNIKHEPSL